MYNYLGCKFVPGESEGIADCLWGFQYAPNSKIKLVTWSGLSCMNCYSSVFSCLTLAFYLCGIPWSVCLSLSGSSPEMSSPLHGFILLLCGNDLLDSGVLSLSLSVFLFFPDSHLTNSFPEPDVFLSILTIPFFFSILKVSPFGFCLSAGLTLINPWTTRKNQMKWKHPPIRDSQIMFLTFADTCLTFSLYEK